MSKIIKKILGASLSLAAFSFSYAPNIWAQSCVVLPTCEELGYTDTADRCENGELLKCPFDESKVFCRVAKAKECTPNACSGYALSSCPANANCSTCDKVNDDCSSGGTKYKLDSCKTTPNACSGYTLSSCPYLGNCSTCNKTNDDCSDGGKKYRLDSCKEGSIKDGDNCIEIDPSAYFNKSSKSCVCYNCFAIDIRSKFPEYDGSDNNELCQKECPKWDSYLSCDKQRDIAYNGSASCPNGLGCYPQYDNDSSFDIDTCLYEAEYAYDQCVAVHGK